MLDHKDAKHLPHSLYSSATHLPGRALSFRTFVDRYLMNLGTRFLLRGLWYLVL